MSRVKRPPKSAYGYVILSLDDYAGTPIPHYNTLAEAQKDFKDWGCDARLLALTAHLKPDAERKLEEAAKRWRQKSQDSMICAYELEDILGIPHPWELHRRKNRRAGG